MCKFVLRNNRCLICVGKSQVNEIENLCECILFDQVICVKFVLSLTVFNLFRIIGKRHKIEFFFFLLIFFSLTIDTNQTFYHLFKGIKFKYSIALLICRQIFFRGKVVN